jgi:hypothetical protein
MCRDAGEEARALLLSYRGLVRWLLLLIGLASCGSSVGSDAGVELGTPADGIVFVPCTAICIRPSDCAQAYSDDGYCPPGFLCSRMFSCNDAGM